MPAELWRDQIYEALLDDEAMAELPDLLARTYGARSCVLHWWHPDGEAEIVSHNGYYPDAEMANYAENFTEKDLWSLRGARLTNEVVNCDDLVSPAEYERSEFYNDWIRAMGDDTFHCLGACVRTDWGMGFVGLHRGKKQGTFDDELTAALTRDMLDLRRMLAIRGRLARAERRANEARDVLATLGDAFFTLSAEGRLIHMNAAAERLVCRGDVLAVRGGHLVALAPSTQQDLLAATALAAHAAGGRAAAIRISRSKARSLDATLVPIAAGEGRGQVLLTVRDPEARDATLQARLRQLYGLSPVEADTAILLSEGLGPADIAEMRGTRIGTVRAQVKALAAKMECHRQVEVAAVVSRLIRLTEAADNRH